MGKLKPGWQRVRFGEVVGLNKETCKQPAAEGIERYIGLEHIDPGGLRVRSWGDVSDGTTFTNRVRSGQVLFGKRRAYQRKVAVAEFDAVCSGDIYVFESADSSKLLPELLPFICQTEAFFDHAVGTSAGSLSPRTNWSSLADYEFALPPLEEQRRISRALKGLSDLDAALLDCEKATVETRNAMAAMNFPVAMTSDRTAALGELCAEITVGIVVQPARWYVPPNEGVLALIMKNVQRGWVDMSETTQISHEGHAAHSKSVLRKGDVVAVRSSGSVGRTGDAAVVPPDLDGANCIDLLIARPGPRLLPEYMCEYLNAPTTRSVLVGRSSGTMQKHLNVSALRKLQIPAVGRDEQHRVVSQLRELTTSVRLQAERRAQLRDVRRQVLAALADEIDR